MLREALAFPRNREGATRDLLIGGALVLASPLLVPSLLLYGYYLRVMNAAARGRTVPPAFGDWGRLLVDGLKALVVVLAWAVVPTVVLVVGTALAAVFVLPLSPTAGVGSPGVALGTVDPQLLAVAGAVVLALALLWFVLVVHLPAALVALATQGRLRAAFHTGALWAVVSTKQYLAGCVLALALAAVGGLLATLLSPVLVGLVLYFYVQVVVAYVVGRAVGGAAVTAIRPLP